MLCLLSYRAAVSGGRAGIEPATHGEGIRRVRTGHSDAALPEIIVRTGKC